MPAIGNKGIQHIVVDQVNFDAFGVEVCSLEQRYGINPDRVCDFGIAEQRQRLRRRRGDRPRPAQAKRKAKHRNDRAARCEPLEKRAEHPVVRSLLRLKRLSIIRFPVL